MCPAAGSSTCSSFRTDMSRNWSIGGRSRWCPRCSKFPRCVSGSFWTKSCKVCRISCSVSVRIDGVWTSSRSVCGRPWSGQRSSSWWKGVCCRSASVFAGHGARESRHARAAPLQHQPCNHVRMMHGMSKGGLLTIAGWNLIMALFLTKLLKLWSARGPDVAWAPECREFLISICADSFVLAGSLKVFGHRLNKLSSQILPQPDGRKKDDQGDHRWAGFRVGRANE